MVVDFNVKVRAAAAVQGVSLKEIERRCEMKPGALFAMLKANNPTLSTVGKVATALNLEPWELLK